MCYLRKKDTGVDRWVLIQKRPIQSFRVHEITEACWTTASTKMQEKQQIQLSRKTSKYPEILHADIISNPSPIQITK